jgi:hypothetical protein
MYFTRGEIEFTLEGDWFEEAGIEPQSRPEGHYNVIQDSSSEIFFVAIDSVYPPKRAEGIPIFNSTEVGGKFVSARERTVSILRAIAQGTPLPPVKVVDLKGSDKYKFKLVDGMHKFHCSIAAGHSHVPAVYGIDINDPYL